MSEAKNTLPAAVLGIDPGTVAGAYAVIGLEQPVVYGVYLFNGWPDVHNNLLPHYHAIVGSVVEKISSRPGEGRVGSCIFCANFGGWEAIAQIISAPTVSVVPRKWQSSVGGRAVKYRSKERIAEVCRELWPDLFIWQTKDKKKLYGYTDALGIALYARSLYT